MNGDDFGDLIVFTSGRIAVVGADGAGGWVRLALIRNPEASYSALRVGPDADHNGFADIAVVAEGGRNRLRFYKEASTPTELSIRPVTPHGGETFVAGSVQFVEWASAVPVGQVGAVTIELSTIGPGGPWEVMAANLPNSGRFQWRIAADTPPTSDGYMRLTIEAEEVTAQGQTVTPFAIVEP